MMIKKIGHHSYFYFIQDLREHVSEFLKGLENAHSALVTSAQEDEQIQPCRLPDHPENFESVFNDIIEKLYTSHYQSYEFNGMKPCFSFHVISSVLHPEVDINHIRQHANKSDQKKCRQKLRDDGLLILSGKSEYILVENWVKYYMKWASGSYSRAIVQRGGNIPSEDIERPTVSHFYKHNGTHQLFHTD